MGKYFSCRFFRNKGSFGSRSGGCGGRGKCIESAASGTAADAVSSSGEDCVAGIRLGAGCDVASFVGSGAAKETFFVLGVWG